MKKNNRRIEEKKKKNTLLYLPLELIIQILLRLPVKSLLRFKCVCKLWFSLISDPHFANSHFQLSSAAPTRRILLMSDSSRSIDFEASSLDDDTFSASLNLNNFMPFESYRGIEIRGSCRGFLLLHCYGKDSWIIDDIYLWNPSTGFHKKIPFSPFSSDLDDDIHFYGFGYDHSTDDYLLVTMLADNSNHPQPTQLEFFSLRANTWKEIEGTQFTYEPIIDGEEPPEGFLFNGAIHWFALCLDLRKKVIVAFNLKEKKLFNMHLPDDFDRDPQCFGLWVFGESLGLWARDYYVLHYLEDDHDYFEVGYDDDLYRKRLDVWVMKEYKVDSPWTKIFAHSFDDIPCKYFIPQCSTKSGDIVGTDGCTLAKCDDKGQLLDYHSYFNNGRLCIQSLCFHSLTNEQA